MPPRTAAALLALASLCGTATAGTNYTDQQVDPTFAELSSPQYWRRIYSSGTVDERGIAVSRMADGSFVTLISVPGGAVGSKIGLVRYGPNGGLHQPHVLKTTKTGDAIELQTHQILLEISSSIKFLRSL